MLLAKIPQPIKCVCLDYSFLTLHNKAQVIFFFHAQNYGHILFR